MKFARASQNSKSPLRDRSISNVKDALALRTKTPYRVNGLRVVVSLAMFGLFVVAIGPRGEAQGPGGEVIRRPPNPPVNPPDHNARLSRTRRQVEEELRLANEALPYDSTEARIKRLTGDESKLNQELDSAEKHYRRALKLNPTEWRAHYGLGNVFYDRERYAESIAEYERAVQLNRRYAESYRGLAQAYVLNKNLTQAVAAYKQLIRLMPNDVSAYRRLGWVYRDQQRYAEEIAAYQEGISHLTESDKPYSDTLYYELGEAYLRVGNKRAAMSQYEVLRSMKSGYADLLLQEINKP